MGATDDFSASTLNSKWRIEGPGDIGFSLASDSDDAWLELTVDAGTHDLWDTNDSARAMQDIADEDFTIQTRFLSTPDSYAQMQGILVEQDADNWIRFDVYSDGTDLHAFAAVTLGGNTSTRLNLVIPEGSGEYLRVSREGDLFTFQYSADGETWQTAGSFTQSLAVASAGLYAGNAGAGAAFTAQADYFEISSDPMTMEDGESYASDFAQSPVEAGAGGPFSDDFSAATLSPDWRVEGPATISTALADDGSDWWLELVTPDGNYDIWNNNTTARVMQDTGDVDFTLATRFLSTPSQKYQMQGFLVEQDASNWIRFDVYSDGNVLRAFAAVTVNGSSSARISSTLVAAAPYLEVLRAGDQWTFRTSADGVTWTTAGSFTHALAVSSTGVFAGNSSIATGYTARVDFFETSLAPLGSEDGTAAAGNLAPIAGDDAFTLLMDGSVLIDTATLLANDSDPDGDTLIITDIGQPTTGSLTYNNDGTWTYTPAAGLTGTDSFTYDISDGTLTDTATVTLTITPPPDSFSDDFSATTLHADWRIEGPSATSTALASDGTDWWLELVTPDGNYDIWNTNNTVRVMQDTDNVDFTLATRFLSTPSEKYQMQGILVEQDAGNWIRFDVYSDGAALRAFAAVTVDGSSATRINLGLLAAAPYLQVLRAGDDWTFRTSTDGETWTTAGSFTHALTVAATGVFAGNSSIATGYTAQVDYFDTSLAPLGSEDGVVPPPDAVDDAFVTDADTPLLLTAADLLSNDFEPQDTTLQVISVGAPQHGTVTENPDGSWTYTPTTGYQGLDSFQYTISDGTREDTATVALTVGTPPPPAFASDDFHDGPLGPQWTVVTPGNTSYALETEGLDSYLALTTGNGNHDIWNANNSVRAMQEVSDTDFGLEARFLSVPGLRYQMQGFVIEEDAANWLRFDVYSDGVGLYAFGASTIEGRSSQAFRMGITAAEAAYLRLDRNGDSFTFAVSADGDTWITVGTLVRSLEVTQTGVFGGSASLGGNFTAEVDYVQIDTDPILTEDGITAPPEAEDDAFATDADQPFGFTLADLTANDFEPDGETLLFVDMSAALHGTITDDGGNSWIYTPDSGFNGYDSFTYTISDGTSEDTATVVLTVGTPPLPELLSDDFHTPNLAVGWQEVLPQGGTVSLGGDADDAFLQIATGSGNFDLWGGTRNAARVMQDISDEDFVYAARFISTPTKAHQMQGFLIEEDDSNWLRYDMYTNGGALYAFAALTIDGGSEVVLQTQISEAVQYLRLTRTGDTFGFAYSEDGETWTEAGSTVHAMALTKAGLFAGSVGTDSALTVQVDYVETAALPLLAEDDGYEPAPAAPVTVDDHFKMDPGTVLSFTADDLLGNDSDINRDELTITGFDGLQSGTINDLGGGAYEYVPNPGFQGTEAFSYTVTDGTFSSTGNVTVLVDLFDAISDDFSGDTLSAAWRYDGIVGFAAIGYDGDEAFAMINSPAGTAVSASGNLTTPRIVQDVLDLDFQIAAGFLNQPEQLYQEHGLLVIEDDGNWLRFDLAYTTGRGLTIIVGTIEDHMTTYLEFDGVSENEVEELRIIRTGNQFSFEYRGNGSDWVVAHVLDREMVVAQVGVFAGSAPYDGVVPGYTAHVDYFENSLAPITDEDGSYVPVNHAPVAMDDNLGVPDVLTFNVADLLANDYDPDLGDTVTVVSLGTVANGTLTDDGGGQYTYTPDDGFQGLDGFTYTITDGALTSEAAVVLNVQKPIEFWHGDVQSFGSPGEGQRWINILGNVAPTVTALSYSLNGGAPVTLSIGPDTRRLQADGDFNIDIDYALLDGSATDDIVTVTAVLEGGAEFSQDVTVQYESGSDWDKNYAIDWSTVSDIQDVVQVVDGHWDWDANGARPAELGYDRLLVLGDQSWDNYELNVTITAHDLENVDPLGRDGGGFAIGMLWDGHTTDRFAGWQPASGYEPGASFFYTHILKSHSYHSFSQSLGNTNAVTLEEGHSYNFTVRVEQTGIYDRIYSIKIWEEGATEPTDWTLQTVETFSLEEAPATGSLYLNAHYFDVTFGDLSVTEITGRDIIQGDETDEVQIAVDPQGSAAGLGEIDVFVGGGGADTFVLGDATGVFYDDLDGSSEGREDYGFVWDFEVGTDIVQLAGAAGDYLLTEDHAGLSPGTAIWRAGTGGDEDELIGILNQVTSLDLFGTSFVYEGLFA